MAVAAALISTAAPATAQSAPSAVITQDHQDASFAYSSDGVAYSDAVPELFAKSPKLVPGESVEEMLWVRNNNSTAVNVSVAALAPAVAGEAALVGVTPSTVVMLEPGDAAPLNLRLWLPESAGNSSRASSWPVQLRLNVSEAVPPGTGELVNTGATGGTWLLPVAAVLLGAGAYRGSQKRSRKL